ncbi:Lrp/AsnC family transcriptional regulator [Roseibium denhamense]|uniref:Transcriptional regulator, AsnC family n=1 Tax=Roseibium denhamense TaxID=76305 RepID=A0ABY1PQ40_9HYPH|nr:Lrp/AsnC family transcriptional regulator [Roseibium denhamense]SMP37485.1 transcriptional regulator, AsnC family [Roseibium denhamense]
MRLDDRDIQILSVLTQDGRVTKAALADRIGLSPTSCWERLKKLEKAGLIEGYGARINLKKLAPHVTVFVAAEIADHTAASFRAFEAAMQNYDEVVACWALGGGFDYLLQIVTRDIDTYQRLIDEMLDASIGMSRYFTYIVTKSVKGQMRLPIDMLFCDQQNSWCAPIGWSGLIFSASSVSGLSERCFLALGADSSRV